VQIYKSHAVKQGAQGGVVGWGTALWKVAGSITDGVIGVFHWHTFQLHCGPWGWLSLQQKWVPGIFPGGGGNGSRCKGLQPYHLRVPIVLKSGSLNLLEPSGPVQRLLYLLPFF